MLKTQQLYLLLALTLFSSCVLIKKDKIKKIIAFSGYNWHIKTHKTPYGPSQNLWSSKLIDLHQGQVYLNISSENGVTIGSEMILKLDSLSYGYYVLQTIGHLESLPEASVFGFFLYEKQFPFREIDIEFGILEKGSLKRRHYTIHDSNSTYKKVSNSLNWDQDSETSTHVIKWEKQNISFGSFNGHINIEELKKRKLKVLKKSIKTKNNQFELHINYWLKHETDKASFPSIGLEKFEYHRLN